MTISEVFQKAVELLGAVGGTAVLAAIVAWLAGMLRDTVKIRISTRQSIKLENHKKEIATELQSLRNAFEEQQKRVDHSLAAFAVALPASHQRVLTAVDLLWKETLKIRDFSGEAFFVYSAFSKKQIESGEVDVGQFVNANFSQLSDIDPFEVELQCPFVGEKLWLLFRIYRLFSVVLLSGLIRDKNQGRFSYWDQDLDNESWSSFSVLSLIIPDEEMAEIMEGPETQVVSAIRDNIENKIISEMNELIFGRKLVDLSIEEQRRIQTFSRELAKDTQEQFKKGTSHV